MTSETSYREKGRAVFLAAIMVLSVVAMSAAFVGGAAADHTTDNYDVGPTFNATDSTNPGDVWIGQTFTLEDDNLAAGDAVSLYEGPDTSGDRVTTNEADAGEVSFDTTDLEAGEPYTIEYHNANDVGFDGATVWPKTEDLEVSFSPATVRDDGKSTLEVSSNRDHQWVTITSDELSADELASIFTGLDDKVESEDAFIAELSDDTGYEADFSQVDVDPQDVSFTFDITDSVGEANTSVTLTDAEVQRTIDAAEGQQGDVIPITMNLEETDTAAVQIGEHSTYNYEVGLTVSKTSDFNESEDEVVVYMNTYLAGGHLDENTYTDGSGDVDPSDVYYGGENVDVTFEYADVGGDSDSNLSAPLAATTYDLLIGDEWDDSSGEWEMNNRGEHSNGLMISEYEAPTGIATLTAPSESITSFEDYQDGKIHATDEIANNDHFFTTVDDFGLSGALEYHGAEFLNETGVGIEFVSTESGVNQPDPTPWAFENGNVSVLNADSYEGDELVLDMDYQGEPDLELDEPYKMTLAVDENVFLQSEDEGPAASFDSEVTVAEPTLEWDSSAEVLSASENAETTLTTNVAPGTELSADLRVTGQPGDTATAVVEKGGTATVTFDTSHLDLETEYDLSADIREGSHNLEATTSGVISESDVNPASFDITANAPSSVTVGDDASLSVTVENTGDVASSQTITVSVDGEELHSEETELESGGTFEQTFDVPTDTAGDVSWEVTTSDDSASGTVTVEEESPDDETGSDGGDGGDDDDGQPGFGVAVALVALLSAAMLALRRQD